MRGGRGSYPAQKGIKRQRIDVAPSRHEKGKLAVVGEGTGQRSQQPGKERKRKAQQQTETEPETKTSTHFLSPCLLRIQGGRWSMYSTDTGGGG